MADQPNHSQPSVLALNRVTLVVHRRPSDCYRLKHTKWATIEAGPNPDDGLPGAYADLVLNYTRTHRDLALCRICFSDVRERTVFYDEAREAMPTAADRYRARVEELSNRDPYGLDVENQSL